MHFRCVFTLLQWYVLVGLDWAKPMMFFFFCCISHAHAFSRIHTFIYLYIHIDIVGAFMCVSFSHKLLKLNLFTFPTWSSILIKFSSSGMILFLSCIMHFILFYLSFGFLKIFWCFSKLMRFLQNFWAGFCLNEF